jgi:hypothetical protein
MTNLDAFSVDFLNHASFVLLLLSNFAKTRVQLHCLSAVSLVFGITFMYLSGISSSVVWLSVLLLQNVFQMIKHASHDVPNHIKLAG